MTVPSFVTDENAVKAGKWLRALGFDTLVFKGGGDDAMIGLALAQGRTILTRDTQIMKRRVVGSGQVKAILLTSDNSLMQVKEVVEKMKLEAAAAFSRCLECNEPLVYREKREVEGLVPKYVYETQQDYSQCLNCSRIFWKGTHWQSMSRELGRILTGGLYDAGCLHL